MTSILELHWFRQLSVRLRGDQIVFELGFITIVLTAHSMGHIIGSVAEPTIRHAFIAGAIAHAAGKLDQDTADFVNNFDKGDAYVDIHQ